jgi:hypothetical protein
VFFIEQTTYRTGGQFGVTVFADNVTVFALEEGEVSRYFHAHRTLQKLCQVSQESLALEHLRVLRFLETLVKVDYFFKPLLALFYIFCPQAGKHSVI